VDLAGLVVHWVDTPGIDERVKDDEAVSVAVEMVRHAALVVHCVDVDGADAALDPRLQSAIRSGTTTLRAVTRCDQQSQKGDSGIKTSSRTGHGIEELVQAVRDGLVDPQILGDPRPWRFWAD
jgi:tRNA U34 5-carboxymethylaminomethyl modifying GTPase MnmE/TrmE